MSQGWVVGVGVGHGAVTEAGTKAAKFCQVVEKPLVVEVAVTIFQVVKEVLAVKIALPEYQRIVSFSRH